MHKDFRVTNYFKDDVKFWFDIYTKYPSNINVLHDKKMHQVVYGAYKNSIKAKKEIIKKLKALAYSKKAYPVFEKKLKKMIKVPTSASKRIDFFNNLIKNLRSQVGQKDMIFSGLKRYQKYQYFLEKIIKKFNLPKELIAISFLESSFNPKAISKAKAAGIWQFMPLIASYFMPKRNKNVDYRFNPIISSLAAFHLLKQNKQILKRYDLAITAYNSGTKNIIKAKRKLGKNTNLETIIKNHKGITFGYASKNFYAEFLALTRVLAYKEEIYKYKFYRPKKKYNIYIAKRKLNPYKLFKLKINNSHILRNKRLKKGFLIVSTSNISNKNFKKIPYKHLYRKYPKNFR